MIDTNDCKWFLMWVLNVLFLELILVYILLVSWEIEAYLLQLLLLVPEWPYWPLNFKGLAFYITKRKLFCMQNWIKAFETPNLFFKECTFYQSYHFFLYSWLSVWVYICISNMFHYILGFYILLVNIWR